MATMLVVGHVTHDRVADGFTPGGSAYYTAQTWRALGADSRVITCVGTDFAAKDAFDGVPAVVRRAGRTTVFRNHYPADGPRAQWVDAVAPSVAPELLPGAWRQPDVLLLAPVFGEVDLSMWRERARPGILAIAVQGWVRTAEPRCVGDTRRVVSRVWRPRSKDLDAVNVALLSDEDLRGQPTLLDRLTARVPLVVRTHGVRGCELLRKGTSTVIGAYATREVDPTGAGDTFAAGFLLGLADGKGPEDAAHMGAAAASIIVESHGGKALPRMAEARARAINLA